jgi:hypothetical protein
MPDQGEPDSAPQDPSSNLKLLRDLKIKSKKLQDGAKNSWSILIYRSMAHSAMNRPNNTSYFLHNSRHRLRSASHMARSSIRDMPHCRAL